MRMGLAFLSLPPVTRKFQHGDGRRFSLARAKGYLII